MTGIAEATLQNANTGFWISISVLSTLVGLVVLKLIYNISPFHPLSKYPGPLLWRASRLPASYHHARGDLYKCIATMHAHYGATVRLAPDELSFTSPSAWPQIYNTRPQLAKSRYHFAANASGRGAAARLPESMITAPDAEHTRLRRLAGPAFLNAGIAEVEPVLQHYVDLLCTQLATASKEGGSTSENMVEWFLWALNDVIGQLALDQEFQCLEKRRMHPWPSFLLGALKQTATVNQFRRFGVSVNLMKMLMPTKAREAQEGFLNTAKTAINQRLAKENNDHDETRVSTSGKKRPDIVGLMLREMKGGEKLSEAEVTANSVLIVGGGAETTSTCLSATIYHLCKTRRAMQRLRDEVRRTFVTSEQITLKAVADMPYLKATIDESLRIFPVASYITPRVTPDGGQLIDGDVVAGRTYVSMGQWYMGRSARFFDNPKEFRPERWLESDTTTRPAGLRVDEVLRPFSLGPRNCIGKLLALAEARLVTAKLLWHFDMELDGDHESWVDDARFYILWQLQPLMVKLTPVQ